MKKTLLLLIILLLGFSAIHFKNIVFASGSPLQISPVHNSTNCANGVFYGTTTYSFTYNGGTVKLSGASDGTGTIYTDDKLDIEVTHSDNSKSTLSQDYGSTGTIVQSAPQNVTSLFKSGTNIVKITMTNIRAPYCASSAYWLVETAGGGGGSTKPNILPRSTWKGDNSGQVVSQTANHMVVHHTATTNDPGNVGTRLRELDLAMRISPNLTSIFNPASTLNTKGDYSSVRDTWAGEVFLIWQQHKLTGYGDIAYQYLIDPTGAIYEGRYKGGLAENADNKGSSVKNANSGAVAISILGRYGSDANITANSIDGGVAQPTNASIQSVQNIVNWLSDKYQISKTGQYQIPQTADGQVSCKLSPDQCYVPNIAGHKDFFSKTQTSSTACPGDNIYSYLPTIRGSSTTQPNGSIITHKSPTGLLIGGFSPIVLGVVDPTGNRLGIDPTTGQYLNNIANGIYGKLNLFDNEDDSNVPTPYALHVPIVTSGVYKIDVVGTGTGSFILASEDLQTSSARAMAGTTTNGQKDNYQVIYNTSNPSQLELFHDTVPPITTGTMTCSRDMNGICRSGATFQLSASDAGTNGDPASGVLKIECSYDNKATWQQCGNATGAQIIRSTNGQFSFWYRSTDRVMNVEAPKYSGLVDVEKFLSIADTAFNTNYATTLNTTGILHSNGSMSFKNSTTVQLDVLNYIGTFTQSGNTTFTYNTKTQVSQTKLIPVYPLSFYKTKCTNYSGAVTLWDTGTTYNKCIYATGDVTINTTNTNGKLTVVSEGYIKDNSTGATLQSWDTTNGVLFYSAKGYITMANDASYTGIIYAPTTKIDGTFSNTTFNGGIYSKTISFGSGTSLSAYQAAGFPTTTYVLPL